MTFVILLYYILIHLTKKRSSIAQSLTYRLVILSYEFSILFKIFFTFIEPLRIAKPVVNKAIIVTTKAKYEIIVMIELLLAKKMIIIIREEIIIKFLNHIFKRLICLV